jgi:hypothetical protein
MIGGLANADDGELTALRAASSPVSSKQAMT